MPLTQLRRSGQALAEFLAPLGRLDPVIIAVPRRGVIVGLEISRALGAPLDVVMAGKVYRDRDATAAVGAAGLGGIRCADLAAASAHGLRPEDLDGAFDAAERRLGERLLVIKGNEAMLDLRDRVVIVVDDAAITGFTMQVALGAVALHRPVRMIGAVALCSETARARLEPRVSALFTLDRASEAIAAARHDEAGAAMCPPLSDEELHALLHAAPRSQHGRPFERLELDGLTAHDR